MRTREPRPGRLALPRPSRRHPGKRRSSPARLRVESLEARSLMAASILDGAQAEVEPNDTVDRAQMLGDMSATPLAVATGTIGNGPGGAADVDWYSFTLDGPAHVSLGLLPGGSDHPLDGVLSLYNSDPLDFLDQYNPLGFRLLARAGGSGGDPLIGLDLGPGTYEVAISGAGNLDFHPLMAGSGLEGATGDYGLRLDAVALPSGPGDGPAVLTSDPAPGAVV